MFENKVINGYIYATRTSTASGQFVSLSTKIGIKTISAAASQQLQVFIPVKKGESFFVNYTAATAGVFRFIYAVGSESEAQ